MAEPNHHRHYPPLEFELYPHEAYTLEALPLTAFTFSAGLKDQDERYGAYLKEHMISRGYRVAPEPYVLKKHGTKARFGIFICGNNSELAREVLPKNWKPVTFPKLVDFLRLAEFQAVILYWQGTPNDGKLPYDTRRFIDMTVNQRGIEVALRAFRRDSKMLRNYKTSLEAIQADTWTGDIYMLSPDISAIYQPENRVEAYGIDRNRPESEDEEEWGGISPLNVGSPLHPSNNEEPPHQPNHPHHNPESRHEAPEDGNNLETNEDGAERHAGADNGNEYQEHRQGNLEAQDEINHHLEAEHNQQGDEAELDAHAEAHEHQQQQVPLPIGNAIVPANIPPPQGDEFPHGNEDAPPTYDQAIAQGPLDDAHASENANVAVQAEDVPPYQAEDLLAPPLAPFPAPVPAPPPAPAPGVAPAPQGLQRFWDNHDDEEDLEELYEAAEVLFGFRNAGDGHHHAGQAGGGAMVNAHPADSPALAPAPAPIPVPGAGRDHVHHDASEEDGDDSEDQEGSSEGDNVASHYVTASDGEDTSEDEDDSEAGIAEEYNDQGGHAYANAGGEDMYYGDDEDYDEEEDEEEYTEDDEEEEDPGRYHIKMPRNDESYPGIGISRKRSPSPAPTSGRNKRERSPIRKRTRVRSPSPAINLEDFQQPKDLGAS